MAFYTADRSNLTNHGLEWTADRHSPNDENFGFEKGDNRQGTAVRRYGIEH